MASLVVVAGQPNPQGKDRSPFGLIDNNRLNEEWMEFTASEACDLTGVELRDITFNNLCVPADNRRVISFSSGQLQAGQRVRVHTGAGVGHWDGTTFHIYAGHPGYFWNNECGDRAIINRGSTVVDYAEYPPRPPEGVLVRQPGTHLLVAASAFGASHGRGR